MPEERPSDPLLSSPALLLLSACDSHTVILNWSRSLVLRIRRTAAVASRVEDPSLSPRNSANSSSRMTRHVGHLNRTCRTVIAPSSHAQRLLHTPGILLSHRKVRSSSYEVVRVARYAPSASLRGDSESPASDPALTYVVLPLKF